MKDLMTQDELNRVLRISRIFGLAVELFEGNVNRAKRWFLSPQIGLGEKTPFEFAATGESGAQEVERLIGRLEHGSVA